MRDCDMSRTEDAGERAEQHRHGNVPFERTCTERIRTHRLETALERTRDGLGQGLCGGVYRRRDAPQRGTDDAHEGALEDRLGAGHLLGEEGGHVGRDRGVAREEVAQVGRERTHEERRRGIVGLFDDQRREGVDERDRGGVVLGEHREHRVECGPVVDPGRLSGERECQCLGDSRVDELGRKFGYQDVEERGCACAHGRVARLGRVEGGGEQLLEGRRIEWMCIGK